MGKPTRFLSSLWTAKTDWQILRSLQFIITRMSMIQCSQLRHPGTQARFSRIWRPVKKFPPRTKNCQITLPHGTRRITPLNHRTVLLAWRPRKWSFSKKGMACMSNFSTTFSRYLIMSLTEATKNPTKCTHKQQT